MAPFIDHIQFFVRRYLLGHAVAQPDLQSPDKPKKGQSTHRTSEYLGTYWAMP